MNHKEYLDLIDRAIDAEAKLRWIASEGSLDGIGPEYAHQSIAFDEYARAVSDLIVALDDYYWDSKPTVYEVYDGEMVLATFSSYTLASEWRKPYGSGWKIRKVYNIEEE